MGSQFCCEPSVVLWAISISEPKVSNIDNISKQLVPLIRLKHQPKPPVLSHWTATNPSSCLVKTCCNGLCTLNLAGLSPKWQFCKKLSDALPTVSFLTKLSLNFNIIQRMKCSQSILLHMSSIVLMYNKHRLIYGAF